MKRIFAAIAGALALAGIGIAPASASVAAHKALTPAVTCTSDHGVITTYTPPGVGGYSLKDVNQYNQGPVTIALTNVTSYCFVNPNKAGAGNLIQYGTNWCLAIDVDGGPQGQDILTVQTCVAGAAWQQWWIDLVQTAGGVAVQSYWNGEVLTQGAVGGEQFLTPYTGKGSQIWLTLINPT